MEPPEIPERRSSKNVLRLSRYSSLMSETTQASLKAKSTRTASIASDVSAMSADSTVSNFLERKIRLHKSSIEYIRSYQDGLREALMSDKLRPLQYEREMAELDEESEDTRHELQIFERQGRTLGLDIEEWYDSHATKRQKTSSEPSTEFMERAYGAVMVPRIMANAKQNRKFNKTKFRSEVIQFYNADGWCHISGGQDDKYIRAAHLVPKCLRGDELTHLFGAGEVVLSDPSNGLTLHQNLEKRLDSGELVIVPIPPASKGDATKWKCILVNKDLRNCTYGRRANFYERRADGTLIELKEPLYVDLFFREIDGKELQFRSQNRPARRYLYFRYVISYLWAKQQGNRDRVEQVDNKGVFWASPGPWVEKSTLKALGRNISGFELPPSVVENNTFDAAANEVGDNQDLAISARLRNANIASLKAQEEVEREDEDDTDPNDSDSDSKST